MHYVPYQSTLDFEKDLILFVLIDFNCIKFYFISRGWEIAFITRPYLYFLCQDVSDEVFPS